VSGVASFEDATFGRKFVGEKELPVKGGGRGRERGRVKLSSRGGAWRKEEIRFEKN